MNDDSQPNEYLDQVPGALEEIEESECWRLLATHPVGRVAVIVGHYPLVFPVNYAVDRRGIVFRTGAGTKLWAIHRSNVAFEVDELDLDDHIGWSVLIKGSAHELTMEHHPDLVAHAESSSAVPWAGGKRESIVRIVPDAITGRRIRPRGRPDLPS
jgi:uncharacterized protein